MGSLTNCPQIPCKMTDKKKEQIRKLMEDAKKNDNPIDWAVAVLC